MTISGIAFVAGERHAFSSVDPSGDSVDGVPTSSQGRGFVLGKETLVRCAVAEVRARAGFDAEFPERLMPDAKLVTALREESLRESPFATERVPPHVAEAGDSRLEKFAEVGFVASSLVTDRREKAILRVGIVSRSSVAVAMGSRRSAIPASSRVARASAPETSCENGYVAVLETTGEPMAFRREMPRTGDEDAAGREFVPVGYGGEGTRPLFVRDEVIWRIDVARPTPAAVVEEEPLDIALAHLSSEGAQEREKDALTMK